MWSSWWLRFYKSKGVENSDIPALGGCARATVVVFSGAVWAGEGGTLLYLALQDYS